MASEMRRAAQALVEHRTETFESRHPLEESRSRFDAAIAALDLGGDARFDREWKTGGGKVLLEARFRPAAHVRWMLNAGSIALSLLVAASAWLIFAAGEGALRFLVPLFTALAILGFPLVALALSSQREARESRIRRAIRKALLDEDERYPPAKKWNDDE